MEYYFDTEVALDEETLAAEAAGAKVKLTPENCKIITMQFQLLDRAGRPASPLIVMKEWDTPGGEEGMIRQFLRENFSAGTNPWEFIPVGYNVLFDLGLLRERAREYGIEMGVWELYHQRPFIDIKHILLGMNGFAFKESGLDKFCGKRNGKQVPVWYQMAKAAEREGKEMTGASAADAYRWIEEYVEEEAAEFVELYARLKSELPRLRTAMGLFNGNSMGVKNGMRG
ncbi:MAG: hypothetical protein Q7T16_04145 [Candidatus Burarchaeum sp.]|nr:hypothetical protein [Candidatus Burarchaeum sp.]MDO8339821.1 hypothetical protein [Candidatus Burarchaeum sp.]